MYVLYTFLFTPDTALNAIVQPIKSRRNKSLYKNKGIGQFDHDVLKFILGSEAWGNNTNEMYYSLLSLKPSQPSIYEFLTVNSFHLDTEYSFGHTTRSRLLLRIYQLYPTMYAKHPFPSRPKQSDIYFGYFSFHVPVYRYLQISIIFSLRLTLCFLC